MKDQLTIEQIFAAMQAIADSIGPNCHESMSRAIQRAKDIEERARIKPAEPKREDYPKSTITDRDLYEATKHAKHPCMGFRFAADTALRHACDKGQIVPRDEFDRAVGDRKVRDMAVARAVSIDACRFGRAFHTDEQLAWIAAQIK